MREPHAAPTPGQSSADPQQSERSFSPRQPIKVTPAEARGDWMEVSTVFSRSYTARVAMSLHALPGAGNLEVLPV